MFSVDAKRLRGIVRGKKYPPGATTESILPRRSIVNARRLPRIESPTNNAPTITDVAIATPNATANEVRQLYLTPETIIDAEVNRADEAGAE